MRSTDIYIPSHYDIDHFDESKSMYDYLKDLHVSDEMIELAKAG